MCLITEQEKPQIAEKDIICYKVIRKNMTSLYYNNFKWEFGKIYTSSVEDFERPNYNAINQAFHSFDSLEGLKKIILHGYTAMLGSQMYHTSWFQILLGKTQLHRWVCIQPTYHKWNDRYQRTVS